MLEHKDSKRRFQGATERMSKRQHSVDLLTFSRPNLAQVESGRFYDNYPIISNKCIPSTRSVPEYLPPTTTLPP